jgi:hypothetical protein
MNTATKAKIEAIANTLLGIASAINPGAGAVAKAVEELGNVNKLFDVGSEFSDLLNEVRAETDATAEQVGGDVSADYIAKRDRMLASFAAHPGRP